MPFGAYKAFFRHVDGLFVGNDPARGPWSEDACHGGPVAGTIVRAFEGAVPKQQLVRLTVNFLRPVPMRGFRIETVVDKAGRAASIATATLAGEDGKRSAVAWALFQAVVAFDSLPNAGVRGPDFDASVPGKFPVARALHDKPFFNAGIEVRYPPGQDHLPGPTTSWMRTLPIVEGEKSTPFQSLCPLADCGNAISRNAEFGSVSFINPDLTLQVHRLPESEWLATDSVSFWEPTGLGMSHSRLFDTAGSVGVALQSLMLRPAG